MDNSHRHIFFNTWQKYINAMALSDQEKEVLAVLKCYPEYTVAIEPEYIPSSKGENPYFVLGAHLELREQLRLNRPFGVVAVYAQAVERWGEKIALEKSLHVLQETLLCAHQTKQPPCYSQYLQSLKFALE